MYYKIGTDICFIYTYIGISTYETFNNRSSSYKNR